MTDDHDFTIYSNAEPHEIADVLGRLDSFTARFMDGGSGWIEKSTSSLGLARLKITAFDKMDLDPYCEIVVAGARLVSVEGLDLEIDPHKYPTDQGMVGWVFYHPDPKEDR